MEMADLTTLAWPAARLGEALEALARTAGLAPRAVEPLPPFIPHPNPLPEGEGTKNLPQKAPGEKGQDLAGALGHDDGALGHWLAAAAGHLGLEAEPMEIPYGEVRASVAADGPSSPTMA